MPSFVCQKSPQQKTSRKVHQLNTTSSTQQTDATVRPDERHYTITLLQSDCPLVTFGNGLRDCHVCVVGPVRFSPLGRRESLLWWRRACPTPPIYVVYLSVTGTRTCTSEYPRNSPSKERERGYCRLYCTVTNHIQRNSSTYLLFLFSFPFLQVWAVPLGSIARTKIQFGRSVRVDI